MLYDVNPAHAPPLCLPSALPQEKCSGEQMASGYPTCRCAGLLDGGWGSAALEGRLVAVKPEVLKVIESSIFDG